MVYSPLSSGMSSWKIHYLKLTIFPATKLHWTRELMINNLFSRAASEKCIGIHQTGTISKIVGEHLWIDSGFESQVSVTLGPISGEKNRGTNHIIPLKSKGVLQIGGWPGLLSISQAGSWSQHFQQSPGIPRFVWVRVCSQSHTGTVGRFVSAVPVDGLFHCNSCPVLISESEHPF